MSLRRWIPAAMDAGPFRFAPGGSAPGGLARDGEGAVRYTMGTQLPPGWRYVDVQTLTDAELLALQDSGPPPPIPWEDMTDDDLQAVASGESSWPVVGP